MRFHRSTIPAFALVAGLALASAEPASAQNGAAVQNYEEDDDGMDWGWLGLLGLLGLLGMRGHKHDHDHVHPAHTHTPPPGTTGMGGTGTRI